MTQTNAQYIHTNYLMTICLGVIWWYVVKDHSGKGCCIFVGKG